MMVVNLLHLFLLCIGMGGLVSNLEWFKHQNARVRISKMAREYHINLKVSC